MSSPECEPRTYDTAYLASRALGTTVIIFNHPEDPNTDAFYIKAGGVSVQYRREDLRTIGDALFERPVDPVGAALTRVQIALANGNLMSSDGTIEHRPYHDLTLANPQTTVE